MHILQVIKGLDIGGQNGGSETFGLNLSRQLRMDGWKITLCSFYRYNTPVEKYWCDQLYKLGIEVIFANPDSHTHLISSIRNLRSECSEKKIALIHSHNQTGTLVAIMLKITGAVSSVIRTAHITQEWGTGPVPWMMRQLFTNWIYPIFVDSEVGVSEAIVNQLNHHPGSRLMRRRPLKIYNAIDMSWLELRNSCYKERSETAPFVIGSVGRLTNRKGYRFLLDALAIIVRSYPNVQLVLVGDGESREKLEAYASNLGIESQVSFLGQRLDVLEILKGFDLFVLPSLQEGLPTVLLESMVCGVPVIATDIPGTRELIENDINGWLVKPGDPEALAVKLQQAIQSPENLDRLRMTAIKSVNKYSFQEISTQYENLYQSLFPKESGWHIHET